MLVPNDPLIPFQGCPTQFDVDQDGYGNACDADISNNSVVGIEDGGYILAAFGASSALSDLTCNGVVGLEDLGQWIADFGKSPPGDSAPAQARIVATPLTIARIGPLAPAALSRRPPRAARIPLVRPASVSSRPRENGRRWVLRAASGGATAEPSTENPPTPSLP